jgi:hypothetical protein
MTGFLVLALTWVTAAPEADGDTGPLRPGRHRRVALVWWNLGMACDRAFPDRRCTGISTSSFSSATSRWRSIVSSSLISRSRGTRGPKWQRAGVDCFAGLTQIRADGRSIRRRSSCGTPADRHRRDSCASALRTMTLSHTSSVIFVRHAAPNVSCRYQSRCTPCATGPG